MSSRRNFIRTTAIAGAGLAFQPSVLQASSDKTFPTVRVEASKRKFRSPIVETTIERVKKSVADPEIGWLFENCFPNTLDTTVDFSVANGKPDTFVITGDINAMWLRDSSAQVWPYLPLMKQDKTLQQLIAGVINRQTKCILIDPYANAFNPENTDDLGWQSDYTDMKLQLHERKWEVDSLCYPVRLAYQYWKQTGDNTPFDAQWVAACKTIVKTFKEQQRKSDKGPYKFQRKGSNPIDSVPLNGYGYPVKPIGLICSIFRPSDDSTIYPFLIPSNFFAVASLRQLAEMHTSILRDTVFAAECTTLANEVEQALQQYAVYPHPQFGKIYAFEVDGFGNHLLMDDANVPSLLAMPYLGSCSVSDPIYQNTRKFVLSENNPYFFKGTYGEGIGGPHVGMDMIWPMSIIMRAMTTSNEAEIKMCIEALKTTHAETGFMHETFHKNDPRNFTRSWFAWANTLFGELILKTLHEKPELLA